MQFRSRRLGGGQLLEQLDRVARGDERRTGAELGQFRLGREFQALIVGQPLLYVQQRDIVAVAVDGLTTQSAQPKRTRMSELTNAARAI